MESTHDDKLIADIPIVREFMQDSITRAGVSGGKSRAHVRVIDRAPVCNTRAIEYGTVAAYVDNARMILRFTDDAHDDNAYERGYLKLMHECITGDIRDTRNGKTHSIFGKTLEFDLQDGFPLLTTKRMFFKGIVEELLFFIRGDTNANHLESAGVNIWKSNTSREFLDSMGLTGYHPGDMGPMYGFNWIHFNAEYTGMDDDYRGKGINQLDYCLHLLKTDPYSRRIMMTSFNPAIASRGCLYPCHGISIIFSACTRDTTLCAVTATHSTIYSLSCMMTQRSADMFLGIPFNIASYALLIHLMCHDINCDETYTGPRFEPGRLIINIADAHVYHAHVTQAQRQILRTPFKFPRVIVRRKADRNHIYDITREDIELVDYKYYPAIRAEMIV